MDTSTDITLEETFARLREFCYYFVHSFEEQLEYLLNILEDNPSKKPTKLPVTVTAALASAIPKIGGHIATGIKKGEEYVSGKVDKKNAFVLAELVYFSDDKKAKLREVLIHGAFELFRVFEMQFMHVDCNGGKRRAMRKLGISASHRLVVYLLNNPTGKDIDPVVITRGVLEGENTVEKLGIVKSGRTLIIADCEDVTTTDLFKRVGVRVPDDDGVVFYKKSKSGTHILGHRLLFYWEDAERIEETWQRDDASSDYHYQLHSVDWAQVLEDIRVYITTKEPLEDIKETNVSKFEQQRDLLVQASVERLNIKHEVLDDNEKKHQEIVNLLKYNTKEITDHTDKKIDEVKGKIAENHVEVTEDLREMHGVISKTNDTLNTTEQKLYEDNCRIKESLIQLEQKVKEAEDHTAIIHIRKNDIEKIEEFGRKIDPMRALSDCGEVKKWKRKLRL